MTNVCFTCKTPVYFGEGESYTKCGTCGNVVRNLGFRACPTALTEAYNRNCECGGELVYNKTYFTGKVFVHDLVCQFCDTVHQFKGAQI